MCVYIYIYTCIEGERERERERDLTITHINTTTHAQLIITHILIIVTIVWYKVVPTILAILLMTWSRSTHNSSWGWGPPRWVAYAQTMRQVPRGKGEKGSEQRVTSVWNCWKGIEWNQCFLARLVRNRYLRKIEQLLRPTGVWQIDILELAVFSDRRGTAEEKCP